MSAANAGIIGAPSSPRSSSGRRVGYLVVQRQPSWRRATSNPVLAPCQAVRPVVPPSRTSRHRAASPQSEPLHVPGARKAGHPHIERVGVATPGGHAPRQAVSRFAGLVLVMESCSPTPCAASAPSSLRPRRKQVFGRQARPGAEESLARRRRQCLRASGGSSLPGG